MKQPGIAEQWSPADGAFSHDVRAGLRLAAKRIAPKYFYDDAGAALFGRICEQPEYYLTRAELEILEAYAPEMAELLGPRTLLIELGAGSTQKTGTLLRHLREPAAFMPIDLSREQLDRSARALGRLRPGLALLPLLADFTRPLSLPSLSPLPRRRAVYFPGSTLGNFEPLHAVQLLRRVRALVGAGGALLIAVDVHKDLALLERAYNDAAGVTAAFNLNLLRRINRELQGDFRLDSFDHHAWYNTHESRIEMHLLSRCAQQVTVQGERFAFARGETLHTENSYKYRPEDFMHLATLAGFSVQRSWSDTLGLFAMHYLLA